MMRSRGVRNGILHGFAMFFSFFFWGGGVRLELPP